jgi:8-hydroxy-5-deazaflavin:NADPH oxidoreductase
MGSAATGLLSVLLALAPTIATSGEMETVALIGTGDMGDSIGPHLAALGYRVVYGSREPASDRVRALVLLTGHGASATTPVEAAQAGDIVFLLVAWPAMESVAQDLGDLSGKIVVDVSMPFEQGADGYPQSMLGTSSAEMIQGWNPKAKVVKALAAQGSQIIDDSLAAGGPISVPIASDFADAKLKVASLVDAMGLDPVDFGPLRMARQIEALQMIYMIPYVQRRKATWEFYFRRSNYWACHAPSESLVPVVDAGALADFPGSQRTFGPCP